MLVPRKRRGDSTSDAPSASPSIRVTWRRMVLLYVALAAVIGVGTVAISRFQRNVFAETSAHVQAEIGALAGLERTLLSAEEPLGKVLYEVGDRASLEEQWRLFQDADGRIRTEIGRLGAAADTAAAAKTIAEAWDPVAREADGARLLWGTGSVAAGLAGGADPYSTTVWEPLRRIKGVLADSLVAVTAELRVLVEEADRRQRFVPPVLIGLVLVALGAALLSARRLSRRVVHPLTDLRHAAARIRDGNLDEAVRLDHAAASEAVELGMAMNDMAAALNRTQQELRHQAFHDPLTGLANRALLGDRLNHAVARQRRSGELLGLILLDLDDFKSINDSLGHWAGDALLANVAGRLQGCVREVDTLARLGGDEFAILLEDLSDAGAAVQVAERIIKELGSDFSFDGRAFPVSASLGIALANSGEGGVDDLVRDADVAMYLTKGSAKGSYTVFEPGMHLAVKERLQLKADLAQAIGTEQLSVHYQPIIDLRSGQVTGVEALARWNHPSRGMISPGEFIPLAEDSGLIVPLGSWVLDAACHEVRGWQDSSGVPAALRLSVNVSGRQLEDPAFAANVRRILDNSGLRPDSLILEITESVVVNRLEDAVPRLHELKALGIQLAIDDFGTGYSSLSSLQQLPVDILKIDKSFIDHLDGDGEQAALARAILNLGQTLELQTVAEGVESGGQAEELRRLDCDMAQGYFFARPTPRGELVELLRNGTGRRASEPIGDGPPGDGTFVTAGRS